MKMKFDLEILSGAGSVDTVSCTRRELRDVSFSIVYYGFGCDTAVCVGNNCSFKYSFS